MNSGLFSPIATRSMSQEVVDIIRQAIVSGRLDFGQHLTETTLSEQMQVSRIPVREALLQLEQEGLLVRLANRGCFVTTFSDQDVREVFSLRATLECMAIEWAVPKFDAASIEDLRRLIEEQHQAALAHDYAGLARLDMCFHEIICLKTGHSRLIKDWYELHAQCQMLLNRRFFTLFIDTPETVALDHTQILNAIASGDVATAKQLTCSISDRVQEECVNMLHLIQQRAASQ